jgi:hypothetical protein
MSFKRNVGALDRILRFGIGSMFVYLGFFNQALINDQLAGTLLGVFGLMFIGIAAIAFCPFYAMIDFSTVREKV